MKAQVSKKSKDRIQVKKTRLRTASAVLSDQDIWHELRHENISIHPFRKKHLQNCSYDVTLGEHYYRASPPSTLTCWNPWNKEHLHTYWDGPSTAIPLLAEQAKELSLPEGTRGIFLDPGESILTHTQEFLGGMNHITTMMKSRSSMMRCQISVCGDAGWGDIGYINRWTMEVTNHSKVRVVLPVGARIAQIVFLYTGVPKFQYQGHYQTAWDLETMVASWKPESMLPALDSTTHSEITSLSSLPVSEVLKDPFRDPKDLIQRPPAESVRKE